MNQRQAYSVEMAWTYRHEVREVCARFYEGEWIVDILFKNGYRRKINKV